MGQSPNLQSSFCNYSIDHHPVAAISIAGTGLDVLGSLYLAYDLLGGQHGPLRLLTRAVKHSIVFGVGYGIGLGLFFGLASGVATGVTTSIELKRAARGLEHYSLPWEGVFAAIRGWPFGAGLYHSLGFFCHCVRPSHHGWADSRLFARHASRFGLCGQSSSSPYATSVLGCITWIMPWAFALRVGLVTGIITRVGVTVNPYIEYYADNLAERRLGAFGIALILCGFAMQSFQYWLALFDVRLT